MLEKPEGREARGPDFLLSTTLAMNEEFILNKELKWRQVGCRLLRSLASRKIQQMNASLRSKITVN